MKPIKYFSHHSVIFLLSCSILTACNPITARISPDLMALNFYQLIVMQDGMPLIEAGLTEELGQPSRAAVTQSAFKCSLRRMQPLNWDAAHDCG